jgi:hypothetical protein
MRYPFVRDDVNQGGVLSPVLSCLYIDTRYWRFVESALAALLAYTNTLVCVVNTMLLAPFCNCNVIYACYA